MPGEKQNAHTLCRQTIEGEVCPGPESPRYYRTLDTENGELVCLRLVPEKE